MSPSLYGSCNQPTNTTLSSFGPQRTWEKKKKKKKTTTSQSHDFFNGNWTEWNPVRSGIIRKTDIKIGRTQKGSTFVNHKNNFRQYFYDGKAVTNLSKQGQLLRNNTYQLNVFRTNIYSCFFFPWKNEANSWPNKVQMILTVQLQIHDSWTLLFSKFLAFS